MPLIKKYFSLLVLLFLYSQESYAYVLSVNSSNRPLSWSNSNGNLNFYITPANSWGLSSSSAINTINNSIDQWDDSSSLNMRGIVTSGGLKNDRSDIVFSSDSSIFNGSGIAGVTMTVSRENGSLVEADILINDTVNHIFFSGDVGDIVSHELGHSIGLDHTQVHRATMFFELNDYQESLHTDDVAGAQVKYPVLSERGKISGKVVGGKNLTPVFGAHVQAISQKSGEVYASSVSGDDGSFAIQGLPSDDQYYIYTSPLKALDTLPSIYEAVKSDFCESRNSYRGGFYESCRSRDEGFPQAVNLNNKSTASAGNISIQCSLDTPVDYQASKNATFQVDLFKSEGVGETFVGYFTPQELSDQQKDEVAIDLTNYNVPGSDHYLEIIISSEDYFSPVKLDVEAFRNSISEGSFPDPSELDGEGVHYSEEGVPTLDVTLRLALDELDPLENAFTVEITPTALEDFVSGKSKNVEDYFPASNSFVNKETFYFFSARIVEEVSAGNFEEVSTKEFTVSDNRLCPQASETYAQVAKSFSNLGSAEREPAADNLPLACGNISDGPAGGAGGGVAVMSLAAMLLTMLLRRKINFCELS